MTPKEKAKELVHKFQYSLKDVNGYTFDESKQCALICVDERKRFIIKEFGDSSPYYYELEEVKQEINKL